MKKVTKTFAVLAVLLATLLAAESAFAWGHSRVRVGVGFYFGAPVLGYPYYYPGPYYYPPYYPAYYPAPVPPQPTVYVEQGGAAAPAQPAQSYWYYCADSRSYYPYVKECPAGWQRVSPQPHG